MQGRKEGSKRCRHELRELLYEMPGGDEGDTKTEKAGETVCPPAIRCSLYSFCLFKPVGDTRLGKTGPVGIIIIPGNVVDTC